MDRQKQELPDTSESGCQECHEVPLLVGLGSAKWALLAEDDTSMHCSIRLFLTGPCGEAGAVDMEGVGLIRWTKQPGRDWHITYASTPRRMLERMAGILGGTSGGE